MNVKQFANVDSHLRDLDNGNELEWREYMGRVVNKLGVDNIAPYIPCDMKRIKKSLAKGDKHLNDIPIKLWDKAAPGLDLILFRNGIRCVSLSEKVCILKETARILCERSKANEI
jgi:hypothetical protein